MAEQEIKLQTKREDATINVTYAELVNLRDNSLLVPGHSYRITNYNTITIQENTQSAGHQFDIIVVADSENTLNENARAIKHKCNIPLKAYSASWDALFNYIGIVDKDGQSYYCYESEHSNSPCQHLIDFKTFSGFQIRDGEYKYTCYTNWYRFKDTPDTDWGDWMETALDGEIMGFVEDPRTIFYFVDADLSAWELKYCLDNDADRFVWADNGVWEAGGFHGLKKAIRVYENSDDIYIHVRYPDGDIDGKLAWAYVSTADDGHPTFNSIYWSEVDPGDLGYTTTEDIIPGETIFEYYGYSAPVIDYREFCGTGVIYYMKDEWNNECPYDFKNIMFKRYYDNEKMIYVQGDSDDNQWCYTFCMLDKFDGLAHDVSVEQFKYPSDENNFWPQHDNIINSYYDNYIYRGDDEKLGISQVLNNTVFVTDTNLCSISEDFSYGEFYGFYYNVLGRDCFSNTFGNGCRSNTFGNYCFSNIFGNYGYSNIFGNECHSNTFGNGCRSNTFGNRYKYNAFGNECCYNIFEYSCSYNTCGNKCYSNTFGSTCSSNTFGNDCCSNTLGYTCYSNTFGNECRSNTFGNGCSYNTFGNAFLSNTFGNNCSYNTFDNGCQSNTFGNRCGSNTFGNTCSYNTFEIPFRHNKIESGIYGIEVYVDKDGDYGDSIIFTHFKSGLHNRDITLKGREDLVYEEYTELIPTIEVGVNNKGEVVQYCLEDLYSGTL